jgi:MFS family permease
LSEIVGRKGSASYAQLYGLVNMIFGIGMILGPSLVECIKWSWNIFMGMFVIGLFSLFYAPVYYLTTRPVKRLLPDLEGKI